MDWTFLKQGGPRFRVVVIKQGPEVRLYMPINLPIKQKEVVTGFKLTEKEAARLKEVFYKAGLSADLKDAHLTSYNIVVPMDVDWNWQNDRRVHAPEVHDVLDVANIRYTTSQKA